MKAIQVDKRKIRIKIKVKLKQKTMESWLGDEQQEFEDQLNGKDPIILPELPPGAVLEAHRSPPVTLRGETPEELAARLARRDTPVPPPREFENPEQWLKKYGGIAKWIETLEDLLWNASDEIPQTFVNGRGQAEAAQAGQKECKARTSWFNYVKNEILSYIKCLRLARIDPERYTDLEAQTDSFFKWMEARVRLARESLFASMAVPDREASGNVNANGQVSSTEIERDVAEGRTSFVRRTPQEIAAANDLLKMTITLLKEIQAERATPGAEVDQFTHEISDALREAARL